jgi:flagellar motor switch protein FliN
MRPYEWIKKVEGALTESREIPLFGKLPPFPWKECERLIEKNLGLSNLSIEPGETTWRPFDELLQGLGTRPLLISLELSPLQGVFHWILSSEDVSKLVPSLLVVEPSAKSVASAEFQEGFYNFSMLEVIQIISLLAPYEGLSLKMASESPLPEEGALSTDISIKVRGFSLWGRLVTPPDFLRSLRVHFQERGSSPLTRSELKDEIVVSLGLEVGKTSLSLKDFERIRSGDFILLDEGSFDLDKREAQLSLTLAHTPLFRVHLQEGLFKIVDYALYHEETSMPRDDDLDDEDEDLDDEDELDDDLDDDEEDDEEDDDDLDDEDEEDEEEDQEELKGEEPQKNEELLSAKEVPIVLTIELGKVKMSLNKLLELKPGNVLELSATPDRPVDVCMNGKRIARAELLKLGELLGIRILRMGA